MYWRRFKLDWSYAIRELFIVTLGVLVALATELQTQANDLVTRLEDYQARIE